MRGDYDDLLDLPHHVSESRPQMPMSDRAAQFSPFAALTGYGDAIAETARLTEQRVELSEEERELLDRKQQYLLSMVTDRPEVTVTYFVPDARKAGGAYVIRSGRLEKVDLSERLMYLTDGTVIALDEIIGIESPLFESDF